MGGVFLVCNEVMDKEAPWARVVDGMTGCTKDGLEQLLREAGFAGIRSETSGRNGLCVLASKS